MAPDKFQQAWQAQASQTRVTVDAGELLKEVQRSRRHFRSTIFWRDVREVGVALVLLPVWFYLGARNSPPWTWYLAVPALIWVAGFIVVDRLRHPQRPGEPGEPLLQSINVSLTQVEHQIWLLRNVFWWYLLPLGLPILVYFIHVAWLASKDWLELLAAGGFSVTFLIILYAFIYYLNQYAVRQSLEPQRQELLTLRASLSDETAGEVSGEYPLMSAKGGECSPRRTFIAGLCSVAIIVSLIAGLVLFVSRQGHPERSPFAAVRWRQSRPEVKVDDEWFNLVSLDGVPAAEIVAFSQRTYGDLWRKRFEEDLVELLTQMGHEPQETVTLVVQSLTSSETRTLEEVPMTRANRQAIRNAAQARERSD